MSPNEAALQDPSVRNLVRKARRRMLRRHLVDQGANTCCAALAGWILLLLFGTGILPWPVALGMPLGVAVFGMYRVKRRMPSHYGVAQLVDRQLELSDSLSTALFFNQTDAAVRVAPEMRLAQFEEATRIAQSVDVRRAVPYRLPRATYVLAGLMLAAGSLSVLRYGVVRRLDLREPLANLLPESLSARPGHPDKTARRNGRQTPETPGEGSTPANQDQPESGAKDPNQTAPATESASAEALARMASLSIPKSGETADTEMASDGADSEGAAGGHADDNQKGQQGDGKGSPGGKQPNGEKPDPSGGGESSSLMNKLKDALQNLLSGAKPQQNQQGAGQQGKERTGAQSKSQAGPKQGNQDGQSTSGGQPGATAQGENGQEARDSENGEQRKGPGQGDSEQKSNQPGGGIGKQDGDKAIHDAEQLAAMGKIGEILGKRAATISGEATAEVQSTHQQLRTPYAQKGAEHTQGGTEINRDEVPVALQPYVQQYFEQVRKQAAVKDGKK